MRIMIIRRAILGLKGVLYVLVYNVSISKITTKISSYRLSEFNPEMMQQVNPVQPTTPF